MKLDCRILMVVAVMLVRSPLWAAPPLDFEAAPISYSRTAPENVITRLQRELDSGETQLSFTDKFGYLPALLEELKIPLSSQMLTFSKTSLQRPLIDPQRPRALYFNDDAYVGYVQKGLIEMIVPDEKLGLVFYTLEQKPGQPQFRRQVARCMTCHSSTRTQNIPGLLVRSMFVDPEGQPVISAGSYRTDHSSPLAQRWGGWYVTGTHGAARHLGNFHLPSARRPRQPVENQDGLNLLTLSKLTGIAAYPTAHSDIVALMVLEHQIDAHNLIVRTNYAWQIDVQQGAEQKADALWRAEAAQLVRHLLFETEVELEYPIKGTSAFTAEFTAQGTVDSEGRSLRQFDLQRRLFRYPCSYMIESASFQALPEVVRLDIYRRLRMMLTGRDAAAALQKLSDTDRQNLLMILPETLPALKQCWEEMKDQMP